MESDHLESSIVRPQNAEHLRPVPHIGPVGQIRPRVLQFERVAIARPGGLPRRQLVERRPMMQFPETHLENDQPHRSAFILQRAALTDKRQKVISEVSGRLLLDDTSLRFTCSTQPYWPSMPGQRFGSA